MGRRCLDVLGWLVMWMGLPGMGFFDTSARSAQPELLVVRPELTDELLANPHMGWQTFHRTRTEDKNLPSWIPSTVHYARWGWGELEPEPGRIDHAFLDGVLQRSRESGQTLAFRVMCCSTTPRHPYHPAWLKDLGGRILQTQRRDGPAVEVPDLDDPKILSAHLDFIRRLGARYDGHPDLDHVDLGSVGWWGEWHMSGAMNAKMPSPQTQKKIVDAYLAAFRKTPLLMLIGGGEMLQHATSHGAGWRADCLGDLGGFSKNWCHMRLAYPKMLPAANALDAWKTAPVAWETCWDMRRWVQEGWSLRYIFNYALACHGSYINNKSAPLPQTPEVRPELERFLRRLGYRLVLKELTHPARVQRGHTIALTTKWQNTGSAPCYRPYRVAYRFVGADGNSKVVRGAATVDRWLPGSVPLFTEPFLDNPPDLPAGPIYDVSDSVRVPSDWSPGRYTVSVGIVDQRDTPVVRLGIKGRGSDGWYALSQIHIE